MRVFLDYHSTTPLDPRVIKAMEPFYSDCFGNPASSHAFGEEAKQAVEDARIKVAELIKAKPENIFFTNSATESNNIIIKSLFKKYYGISSYILTTNTEHSSINNTISKIVKKDSSMNWFKLNINNEGSISLDKLEEMVYYYKPTLVSIIAANNEIGTIHDIKKIGEICKKYGINFHTDATQAIGKIDINVDKMNLFALTISAHKIYGPKGVGVLYAREPERLEPVIDGGLQNILSSGTQNVPGIVGLGEACRILNSAENKADNSRIKKLRDYMVKKLLEMPDTFINGSMKNRLPNNINVTIKGIKAEVLVKGMSDVIISGGSACQSGNLESSSVILALGTPYSDCAVRISLGKQTTINDIDYAIDRIKNIVIDIRGNLK